MLGHCLERGSPAHSLVIRNITNRREASKKQRKAIACDHLTGISNRRTFFEAAELEFSRGKRYPRNLSLAMFNVDRFKSVNDTHGRGAAIWYLGAFLL